MAKIYPSLSNMVSESAAERQLVAAFTEQLDNTWTIIHSLAWVDTAGSRLSQGECDFVLLHPQYGWLAIEAKTGSLQPDHATGKWRSSGGVLIQDPVKQAQKSMFQLEREFAKKLDFWEQAGLPYGYAVALPHTRRLPEPLPLHATRELFILEGDMGRLEARVKEMLAFQSGDKRSQPPLAQAEYEKLLSMLLPQFQIMPSLYRQMEAEREAMIQLTKQQAFFLQHAMQAPRVLVTGSSGSGKTLLALEEARQLADEGAQVLFLCFNRSLADHLGHLIGDNSAITVSSFHSFARAVITAAGMEYPVPTGVKEQSHFFEHDVPELFVSALPAYDKRFDAVLVDEAQDFRDTWWVCVYEILRDEKQSILHLFGDDRQNLFGRSDAFPFSEPHIQLRLNCRNTQEIARWIERETSVPVATNSWCPEGEDPVVTHVASDHEEREAIRRLLHMLFVEERLASEHVMMLGVASLNKSIFADQQTIGPYRIKKHAVTQGTTSAREPSDTTEDTGKPMIRYSTIHSFKGLEADVVILTGIGLPTRHGEDANTLLYVGASRARHRLFVFKRTDTAPA